MKELFIHLCNFSVVSSIAVLAAVVLRPLLKKGPSFIRCALLTLVFLRLLVPIELWNMPFSMPAFFETEETVLVPEEEKVGAEENGTVSFAPPVSDTVEKPTVNDTAENPPVNGTVDYVPKEPANDTVTESQKPVTPPVADAPDTENTVEAKEESKTDVLKVLSVIWVSGVALMLGYMLISNLALKLKVRGAVVYDSNIRILGKECSPFVFGFFKPVIYIPASIDKRDWGHIIAHESSHIKRLDHIVKPLAFIALSVYWYNPLVWIAYILLSKDIEYACDERTVKTMASEDKKAYSMALLAVSQQRGRIFAPLSFGEVNVKERIKRVMKFKNTVWAVALTAVICISLIAFIACSSATDGNTESYDEESSVESSEISEDNEESSAVKTITIYVPNAADGFDSYETFVIEAEPTAENIVRYCIEKGNFPEGSEMLSFEIRDRVGYLDMNSTCYELSTTYHDNAGKAAVCKTFVENLDIDSLVITYDGKDPTAAPNITIFNTDNIAHITFYNYSGGGVGADVEEEHMEEIINWLKSFTIGEKYPDEPLDGDGNIVIGITYADGTVIKDAIDTVRVNGVEYYTKHDGYPDCYWKILSRTKLEPDYKTTEERTNYALGKTYTMEKEKVDADFAMYPYLGEYSGTIRGVITILKS